MSKVTIYHNPACGNSRNTLALLRHAGLEPQVIEYLKTPLNKEQLAELLSHMDIGVRGLIRAKQDIYAELQLDDAKWSDDELLGFMAQHPILMNRPVVVTPLGTKLCRPPQEVLELLPVPRIAPFTLSNGTVIEDDGTRRRKT